MYYLLNKNGNYKIVTKKWNDVYFYVNVLTTGFSFLEHNNICVKVQYEGKSYIANRNHVKEANRLISKLLIHDNFFQLNAELVNLPENDWQNLLATIYDTIILITGDKTLSKEESNIVEENRND